MEKTSITAVNRRAFLKGAGSVGLGAAALGLFACSGTAQAEADSADAPAPRTVAETIETDIVIIGAGNAGLAAAVQAGEEGLATIILEKMAQVGGNGAITEGIFGMNSSLQKEQGISFTFKDIVVDEAETFNYSVNLLFWKDMVDASGANIDWLLSHGVQIERVDDYHGFSIVLGCHAWKDDKGSESFTAPMKAAAESRGTQILTSTPVDELILEDGRVVGVYAQREDGSTLAVRGRAVIIATGGYLNDEARMIRKGYEPGSFLDGGLAGHDGDGLNLAVSAGGVDRIMNRCFVEQSIFYEVPKITNPIARMAQGIGSSLWINGNCERYVNENCAAKIIGRGVKAIKTQQASYVVMSTDYLSAKGLLEAAEETLAADTSGTKFKGSTIGEAATNAGLDAAALAATLERYNQLCARGSDDDFGKPAEFMVPLGEGPFYIFEQQPKILNSVGGIHCNRNMQVVDELEEPVEGLYAIGADGCELYAEMYTLSVSGSCNGYNIYSGRKAVEHIAQGL
ncbi:MAG: FAD-dependent oxidoreductase [Coriobacteriales bacterium]|jgi:fumarate reductase flavoprotein subunit|nr:FAD-dependent oxidoreductase [Coriobacteriales bacterium]